MKPGIPIEKHETKQNEKWIKQEHNFIKKS